MSVGFLSEYYIQRLKFVCCFIRTPFTLTVAKKLKSVDSDVECVTIFLKASHLKYRIM